MSEHAGLLAAMRVELAQHVAHVVRIPGIDGEFHATAADRDEALRQALDHYGMHFAPDGTTVTPIDEAP